MPAKKYICKFTFCRAYGFDTAASVVLIQEVMMLSLFLAFVAVALYCEYSLWRRIYNDWKGRWPVWLYAVPTVSIWGVLLFCIVRFMVVSDTGSGFTRFLGVVLIIFFFNCLAKMIYLLFAYLGRITGKKRAMGTVSWILIILLGTVMSYGATAGRSRIRVEEEVFASARVPEAFDGFRIVLFSDVHTGLLLNRDRILEELVQTVNALDADVAVNCGDIVNYDYRELEPRVMNILSGMESRYGVYAVLGNHDLGIYIRDTSTYNPRENICRIEEAQESIGWRMLRDTSVMIIREADTISVTGLGFPDELVRRSHKRMADTIDVSGAYRGVPDGMFNVTVSHAPQAWDAIRGAGRGDVTLSGHVHSLQMKFSVGGRHWSPAAWFYDRWSGAYREDDRLLYINDGIGYAMMPMRIGTRPEVTLIILKRDENDSIGGGIE